MRIFAVLLAAIAATSGCRSVSADPLECTYWDVMLRDERLRAEVLAWLDAHVLRRELFDSDRSLGNLVIPGRHGALRSSVLQESMPFSLLGSEIRPIYFSEEGRVMAVFIGKKNSVGIFVDAVDIAELVRQSEIQEGAFEWHSGRVGLSCGEEDR